MALVSFSSGTFKRMANCGIGIGEGAPNWELQKKKDESKCLVYTRRRGYEITRNPHLNKVKGWAAESAGCRVCGVKGCCW